jgi:hypothetical protein
MYCGFTVSITSFDFVIGASFVASKEVELRVPGYLYLSQSAVAISRLRIITFTLKIELCEVICKENFPPVTTVWHSGEKKLPEKGQIAFFTLKTQILFQTILALNGPDWPQIGQFLIFFAIIWLPCRRRVRYAVRMRSIRSDRSVR